MFAFAAAVVAALFLLDVITNAETALWLWLLFIALQFAFGWGLPIGQPAWTSRRNPNA
jgi:hypothetical protein